jgi:prepilin-type N-terminal cleavage/methylation domain-containing protein
MRRAFTLVEVLIVIAILALIAASILPTWVKMRHKDCGPNCPIRMQIEHRHPDCSCKGTCPCHR